MAPEVTATVREVVACFSPTDSGRALALVSASFARSFRPNLEQSPEEVRAILNMGETTLLRRRLQTDPAVKEDGRGGTFVVAVNPPVPPEGDETAIVGCVNAGDRWVADEGVEFAAAEEGQVGTAQEISSVIGPSRHGLGDPTRAIR